MFFGHHNSYEYYYGPNTPGMQYSNAMSTASVVLCLLAIFGNIAFYIAIPCGALSIIFALLSRGSNRKLMSKCKVAIVLSTIGMLSSVAVTIASVHTVLSDPELRAQLAYTFNLYAQEMGLDVEFDDYFGDGSSAEPSPASPADGWRSDLSDGLPDAAPGDGGSLPDDPSGGFYGSPQEPSDQQIPQGGEYI